MRHGGLPTPDSTVRPPGRLALGLRFPSSQSRTLDRASRPHGGYAFLIFLIRLGPLTPLGPTPGQQELLGASTIFTPAPSNARACSRGTSRSSSQILSIFTFHARELSRRGPSPVAWGGAFRGACLVLARPPGLHAKAAHHLRLVLPPGLGKDHNLDLEGERRQVGA